MKTMRTDIAQAYDSVEREFTKTQASRLAARKRFYAEVHGILDTWLEEKLAGWLAGMHHPPFHRIWTFREVPYVDYLLKPVGRSFFIPDSLYVEAWNKLDELVSPLFQLSWVNPSDKSRGICVIFNAAQGLRTESEARRAKEECSSSREEMIEADK